MRLRLNINIYLLPIIRWWNIKLWIFYSYFRPHCSNCCSPGGFSVVSEYNQWTSLSHCLVPRMRFVYPPLSMTWWWWRLCERPDSGRGIRSAFFVRRPTNNSTVLLAGYRMANYTVRSYRIRKCWLGSDFRSTHTVDHGTFFLLLLPHERTYTKHHYRLSHVFSSIITRNLFISTMLRACFTNIPLGERCDRIGHHRQTDTRNYKKRTRSCLLCGFRRIRRKTLIYWQLPEWL